MEPDTSSADDESPSKSKKKEMARMEKKFLWPHGITPPCNNVRKRRFRKTLKKRYIDVPEIEREVKCLLRSDNEAISIKYDVVQEEEQPRYDLSSQESTITESTAEEISEATTTEPSTCTPSTSTSANTKKKEHRSKAKSKPESKTSKSNRSIAMYIFGGDLSSSSDEENHPIDVEMHCPGSSLNSQMSEFSTEVHSKHNYPPASSSQKSLGFDRLQQSSMETEDDDITDQGRFLTPEGLCYEILEQTRKLEDLKREYSQKGKEIESIQNPTLKSRIQNAKDCLMVKIMDKESQVRGTNNSTETDWKKNCLFFSFLQVKAMNMMRNRFMLSMPHPPST